MIELLVTYLFHCINIALFLFLFHTLLHQKINYLKFALWVVGGSLIQSITDIGTISRGLIALKDSVFLIVFLVLYHHDRKLTSIISAVLLNSLFFLSLAIILTIAKIVSIDMVLISQFGLYYIGFTVISEILIILFMCGFIHKLMQTEMNCFVKPYFTLSGNLIMCMILSTFILHIAHTNQETVLIQILLIVCSCFTLYLPLNYASICKKDFEIQVFQEMMKMEESRIHQYVAENKHTNQLMHDTKNMLLKLQKTMNEQQYDSIHTILNDWQFKYHAYIRVPICSNVYIDAILQYMMHEYPEIQFNLTLQIPDALPMDTKHLFTILNIVLNAVCKQIHPKEFDFSILGNENEFLMICKTEKYSKKEVLRSFEENYLQDIIKQYQGRLTIEKDSGFHCNIFLILS